MHPVLAINLLSSDSNNNIDFYVKTSPFQFTLVTRFAISVVTITVCILHTIDLVNLIY